MRLQRLFGWFDERPLGKGAPKAEMRRMLEPIPADTSAGVRSCIPAFPAWTHRGTTGFVLPPSLITAGCTKPEQPRGAFSRSLTMEKSLRGAAAPSLLPAGAGLGTASIDPIAARWDQQQGGSGGGGQTLPQRSFLSLWLSGIPLRDRLPGSPQCPRPLPRSSVCRGGGDVVQQELPRCPSFPPLFSSKASSPLSSQASLEAPAPNPSQGQPSHLPTVRLLRSGHCCEGPRNR